MANKKVLLINDNEAVTRYLREELMMSEGYLVTVASTSEEGVEAFCRETYDMVLAKYGHESSEGAALVQELRKIDPLCMIVAILESVDPALLMQVHGLGLFDFVTVPLNMEKILFLVKKGVELHTTICMYKKQVLGLQEQNVALQKRSLAMAKRIEESSSNLASLHVKLADSYMRTIRVLAQAIDSRDHYTHSHSENVAKFATAIASEMRLPAKDIDVLAEACELHDLGKIGIEDSILTKPGPLTPQEWEVMKRHPVIGAQILEPLTFLHSRIDLVLQHHEHFDGTGYPEGRKGADILLGARILHLADAYEAMTAARSYRKVPLSKEAATAEIKKHSGTQFDPKVVEAFLRVVNTF